MQKLINVWRGSLIGKLIIMVGFFILFCGTCLVLTAIFPASSNPLPASVDTAELPPAPTETAQPSATPTPSPDDVAAEYFATYGGNLDVYKEILSLTDCALLQEKFDIASANNGRAQPGTVQFRWTLGYMTAADDRMRSAGCY